MIFTLRWKLNSGDAHEENLRVQLYLVDLWQLLSLQLTESPMSAYNMIPSCYTMIMLGIKQKIEDSRCRDI